MIFTNKCILKRQHWALHPLNSSLGPDKLVGDHGENISQTENKEQEARHQGREEGGPLHCFPSLPFSSSYTSYFLAHFPDSFPTIPHQASIQRK